MSNHDTSSWNSWWCIFAAVLLQLWKSIQDITDITVTMQYFCQDQFLHNDSSIPAARGKGVCDILSMPLCSILVLFFFNHWHKLRYSQVVLCLFPTKIHFQVPNLLKTLTLLDLKDQDSTELEVMFSSLCCWWSEQDGQCSVYSWASERATRGAARLDILQI